MHTIYCACTQIHCGVESLAISDDGEVQAYHISSDEAFAKQDMGFGESTRKHGLYNEKFGVGNWLLEWVDHPATHPGWQAATELNKLNRATEAARQARMLGEAPYAH
jgi:hypothetical protein